MSDDRIEYDENSWVTTHWVGKNSRWCILMPLCPTEYLGIESSHSYQINSVVKTVVNAYE